MQMVTNDNVGHIENEYPAMNEVFTRRPVREKRINHCRKLVSLILFFKANQ